MAAKALLVALVLLTVTLPAAAARRQDQETIEVSISRGCPAALYALYGVPEPWSWAYDCLVPQT